jgi:hypothetical protein
VGIPIIRIPNDIRHSSTANANRFFIQNICYTTRLDIKVDTKHFLIQLPGSWSNLIIMLLIFSLKYFFGYDLAVNPHHAELMEYKLSMFAVSGLLTGFLQGRLIGYLYHFKNGANFNLETRKR